MLAMRTFKRPLPLIGCFKLPMEIVLLLAALAHPDTFPKPAESCDPSLGFGHVTGRKLPAFIRKDPTNRTTLKIGSVVRSEHPQRHPARKMDRLVPLLVRITGKAISDRLADFKQLLET